MLFCMESVGPIDSEKFIEFKCPFCKKTVSFQEEFVGRAQRCPECAEAVIVPSDGAEFGKVLPVPIKTERLILRKFQPADAADVAEIFSDESMWEWKREEPFDEMAATKWLAERAESGFTVDVSTLYLAMSVKSTGKVIGYVSIESSDVWHAQAHIGLVVNPTFQEQGYGTEAMRAVVAFCFEATGMHRVSGSCYSEDSCYKRVFEKSGMRLEGESIDNFLLRGQWASTCYYAILEAEYQRRKSEPAGNESKP